jgi:predicted DNA-binding antitoxin AbrB/MazE fold protein
MGISSISKTSRMSIKVEYLNGVFKPLENVENIQPGRMYTVFSDDELRSLATNLDMLKASEKSFEFWNNADDSVYDTL